MHRQMSDMMKKMGKMGGRMPAGLSGLMGGQMPQIPPGLLPRGK
jgi:hypothetical protein